MASLLWLVSLLTTGCGLILNVDRDQEVVADSSVVLPDTNLVDTIPLVCGDDECTPCEVCMDGVCVPLGDGASCGMGTCWSAECCMGCLAGDSCESGGDDATCGSGGNACVACASGSRCEGGACVVDSAANVSFVEAGFFANVCAITTNGRMYCWGNDPTGLLGTTHVPTRFSAAEPITDVALAQTSGCLIDDFRAVECWGSPFMGPIDSEGYSDVDLGTSHGCAIQVSTSYLICFGDNTSGQAGNMDTGGFLGPTLVDVSRWSDVSTGGESTCAIDEERDLYCFGSNAHAQVAGASRSVSGTYVPRIVDLERRSWAEVSVGLTAACAVTEGGDLYCWGDQDSSGVVGGIALLEQRPRLRGTGFASVSVAPQHACAIKDSGELYCWGISMSAAHGTTRPLAAPTLVDLGGARVARVSAGGQHTCVVTEDRRLLCWGSNAFGQLGQPADTTIHPAPGFEVPIPDG